MLKITAAVGLSILVGGSPAQAQSLKGSRAAMVRQNQIAHREDFTFLSTSAEVRRFVESGLLVPLRGNADYHVEDVSFPYARAAVRLFVERVAGQYHSACGEKLVVTSLTRPLSRQPRNSHELSVHPTGMAADLRVSRKSSCRKWLESALKDLEGERVLDATRERRPSHYHIAVFPDAYTRYVARQGGSNVSKVAVSTESSDSIKIAAVDPGPAYASVVPAPSAPAKPVPLPSVPAKPATEIYTVKSGDSLWTIARRFATSVLALKQANQLARSTIQPGQKLVIPGSASANADELE